MQGEGSTSDDYYARGHYGSERDDAVTFYPQDFWAAAEDVDHTSPSPCDMFRRRLTVVHAPEPSLRLPYFDGSDSGMDVGTWAESLASRTRKAHVLRRWLLEHGSPAEDTEK